MRIASKAQGWIHCDRAALHPRGARAAIATEEEGHTRLLLAKLALGPHDSRDHDLTAGEGQLYFYFDKATSTSTLLSATCTMYMLALQTLGLAVIFAGAYLAWHIRRQPEPVTSGNHNPASPNKVPSPSAESSHSSKSIWHANKEKGEGDSLPNPKPLLDFDLKTAKTRDYVYVNKTLRYPYYQTMAHQPMEIDNWIEISTDYEWYLSEKKKVIESEVTLPPIDIFNL